MRPEARVQSAVKKLYKAAGCIVYETSETRRTRATPGIPDLIVFDLRRRQMFFHETKTDEGRLSDAQAEFRQFASRCGLTVVVGGTQDALDHLDREHL